MRGRSLSAIANKAVREAVESAAHRRALLEWLDDELDEKHGKATPEQQAESKAFFNEVFGPVEADDEVTGAA